MSSPLNAFFDNLEDLIALPDPVPLDPLEFEPHSDRVIVCTGTRVTVPEPTAVPMVIRDGMLTARDE